MYMTNYDMIQTYLSQYRAQPCFQPAKSTAKLLCLQVISKVALTVFQLQETCTLRLAPFHGISLGTQQSKISYNDEHTVHF